MADAVESVTGKKLPGERDIYAKGAGEAELVASGLEDTMIDAYRQICEAQQSYQPKPDLRTSAFLCAINKIALCYEELGIYP